MGKKFDALRGRSFDASKFHALLNLAVSRLAVLRNQRQARRNLARSDVVQILHLGHHDRALLRVEQVIKEQNMLDVFVLMEGYCNLMGERINLIEHERECPEELKEAISSMLYASTRCGEFPELQEMRAIFTARYGKEFVARATELRNNCGVNPKVLQKLSTRQPSLENRLKVLKEIASENNIVLQVEQDSSMIIEGNLETKQKQQQQHKPESSTISGGCKERENFHNYTEEMENMEEGVSDSMKAPRKYKDVADAAQAAFKSAAYAAAAARAAVELSKSESHYPDDGRNGSGSGKRKASDERDGIESELETTEENNLRRVEDQNVGMGFGRVDPVQNYDSESEDEEIHGEKRAEESEESKTAMNGVNWDSDSEASKGNGVPSDEVGEKRPMDDKGINSDESDDETGNKTHELGSDTKSSFPMNEEDHLVSNKPDTVMDEDRFQSEKKLRVGFRAGLKARLRAWKSC